LAAHFAIEKRPFAEFFDVDKNILDPPVRLQPWSETLDEAMAHSIRDLKPMRPVLKLSNHAG
jgi:hypothetical protein